MGWIINCHSLSFSDTSICTYFVFRLSSMVWNYYWCDASCRYCVVNFTKSLSWVEPWQSYFDVLFIGFDFYLLLQKETSILKKITMKSCGFNFCIFSFSFLIFVSPLYRIVHVFVCCSYFVLFAIVCIFLSIKSSHGVFVIWCHNFQVAFDSKPNEGLTLIVISYRQFCEPPNLSRI